MKKLLKKLDPRHKVVRCPNCRTQLRFPIKPGKTLRIKCPHCISQFDIVFRNPLRDVFSVGSAPTLWQKVCAVGVNYRGLPAQERKQLGFLLISFVILITMIVLALVTKPVSTSSPPPDRPSVETEIDI